MNTEEMISEKDKEYIQKQISKAIKSYPWEKKTHELMDSYMNCVYDMSMLDDVFVDLMKEVLQKVLKEKGLIE